MASSIALAVVASVSCGSRTALVDRPIVTNEAGPDASVPCTPGTFSLSRAQPSVMFVLDASGSMDESFAADGSSRWRVLTSTMQDVLPSVDEQMSIGAIIFPTGHSSQSCGVSLSPNIDPALGQTNAIVSLMESTSPLGGTPTAEAITLASQSLLGIRAASLARAIILATDGGPNCNAALDTRTCTCADPTLTDCGAEPELCLDDTRTISRIASSASSGLPTYVIGIHDPGDTQNDSVLNAMADAGGRPRSGSSQHYFAATSPSDLQSALVDIRNQLGSCTYLTSSVPSESGSIVVTVDGVVVPYDPTGQ
ncbi:MAG TPA: vWA domain-containing protein, partial [Polyangiaceae bacterium]